MTTITRLFSAVLLGTALIATGAQAQGVKKPKPDHCDSRMAQACDTLADLTEIDSAWTVAAYGAAMCSKSMSIEKARKSRKSRYQMDEYQAKLAKDEDREYKRWKPVESDDDFTRRTRAECTDSLAYYCQTMAEKAAALPGEDAKTAGEVVAAACGK